MQILQKVKMLGDVSRFSWSQAFSNQDGKTSITAPAGAFITFLGGVVFTYASFTRNLPIVMQAVIVLGIGASLLGVNKVMGGKPLLQDTVVDDNQPDTKDATDVSTPPSGPTETN